MADRFLDVEIITPQKLLYSGKAVSVLVPGGLAPFQILYNHAPIISTLEMGIIKIGDENGKMRFFASTEGFVEVRTNKVSILVESADDAATLDISEVSASLIILKDKLKNTDNSMEIPGIKRLIAIEENRYKAYQNQSNSG